MTFYDIKDDVFVKKIANCIKCEKPKVTPLRVGRLDFWKILPLRLQFPFTLTSPPAPISHTCRPRLGSTM